MIMGQPAARATDAVISIHQPPILNPQAGSLNVFIGGFRAWRGMPTGDVGGLKNAKEAADLAIQIAESDTKAATGTPRYSSAKATEDEIKFAKQESMSSLIEKVSGGADIHICSTPLPPPPHGPGVVIDGSSTVFINGLPACFTGCTILEAVGPFNKILGGCPTVFIG